MTRVDGQQDDRDALGERLADLVGGPGPRQAPEVVVHPRSPYSVAAMAHPTAPPIALLLAAAHGRALHPLRPGAGPAARPRGRRGGRAAGALRRAGPPAGLARRRPRLGAGAASAPGRRAGRGDDLPPLPTALRPRRGRALARVRAVVRPVRSHARRAGRFTANRAPPRRTAHRGIGVGGSRIRRVDDPGRVGAGCRAGRHPHALGGRLVPGARPRGRGDRGLLRDERAADRLEAAARRWARRWATSSSCCSSAP